MFDQGSINGFINQIVLTLDNLFKDKKVSQELLDYLYLIAAGMITNYGIQYYGDILKVFEDVNFAYGKKDVYAKVNDDLKLQLDREFSNNSCAEALTMFDIHEIGKFGYLPMLKIDYLVCVLNNKANSLTLLEYLTHELNHILMSQKNTFSFKEDAILLRNGLFKALVVGDNHPLESGRAINEVVNTLQTEDVMKCIFSFKNYGIENEKFNNALKIVENANKLTYRASGYELFVNLFRPLYEEDAIKKMFNRNIIEGKVDEVHKYFDDVLGVGSFDRMSKKLDSIYVLLTRGKIGRQVSNFEFSSDMVIIRDTFVKKFADKKFGYKRN